MANSVMQLMAHLAALTPANACYLAIAVKELFIARVRHSTTQAGTLIQELRSRQSPIARAVGAPMKALDVGRLSWAIGAAAAHVPWRADCLVRAMAAERWLRRHGMQPEFCLGVVLRPETGLSAHAWLQCGGIAVTGGESGDYTRFIEPPADRMSGA